MIRDDVSCVFSGMTGAFGGMRVLEESLSNKLGGFAWVSIDSNENESPSKGGSGFFNAVILRYKVCKHLGASN